MVGYFLDKDVRHIGPQSGAFAASTFTISTQRSTPTRHSFQLFDELSSIRKPRRDDGVHMFHASSKFLRCFGGNFDDFCNGIQCFQFQRITNGEFFRVGLSRQLYSIFFFVLPPISPLTANISNESNRLAQVDGLSHSCAATLSLRIQDGARYFRGSC